jgi:hypothetical protein
MKHRIFEDLVFSYTRQFQQYNKLFVFFFFVYKELMK